MPESCRFCRFTLTRAYLLEKVVISRAREHRFGGASDPRPAGGGSGCVLAAFWLHSGCILAPSWLRSGSVLAPFWLRSGSVLAPAWLRSGSVLAPLCLSYLGVVVFLAPHPALDNSTTSAGRLQP